jgi:small conductance mechanosensitive channel
MPFHRLITSVLTLPTAIDTGGDVLVDDDLSSGQWLRAGIIVVSTILVAIAASRITRAVLMRALGSGFAAILTARIVGYSIFLIGLIYALNSLGVRVGPLLGALGLGGLVLALALQKVVENFTGALILQTRRPFTVGETVDLDGHVGVIVDIDSRTVVMKGLDGTIIRMPNAEVLDHTIINLTRNAHRRSELQVGVAYDSNLERATQVLTEAAERVRRIPEAPAPMVVLRQFGESSIDFTILYWHRSDVPSELMATHDLTLSVHQALAAADITIAFPQLVVWPSHDAEDNPYYGEPHTVFTERPRPIEAPPGSTVRRRTFFRRRGA